MIDHPCYKIVYHDPVSFRRISMSVRGKFVVEYRPGVWTRCAVDFDPYQYGAVVFQSLYDVDRYLDGLPGYEVWESRCRGIVPRLPPRLVDSELLSSDRYQEWMRSSMDWPSGTIMAEEVMLLTKLRS